MSAVERLTAYARLLEDALPGYLPDLPPPEKAVADAMGYSLLGGGKRIRGALTLAFHELLTGKIEPALPFAGALEMVHAYSLIHDDLPCMDDDDIRRGKPSCHIAFGEATALLAGDGLLNLAFETMTDPRHAVLFPSGRVVEAVRCLSAASGCGGMIGGQVIDLAQEGKDTDEELHLRMTTKKTGALIRAAGELGCILGGADENLRAAAVEYCGHIGAAFQIRDDILDVQGDARALGKPVGSDAARGKCTWVRLYGLEGAKAKAQALEDAAKGLLEAIPGDTSFFLGLVDLLAARHS